MSAWVTINIQLFRETIERDLAAAVQDIQLALRKNQDNQYWAAQGRVAAYKHVLNLLKLEELGKTP